MEHLLINRHFYWFGYKRSYRSYRRSYYRAIKMCKCNYKFFILFINLLWLISFFGLEIFCWLFFTKLYILHLVCIINNLEKILLFFTFYFGFVFIKNKNFFIFDFYTWIKNIKWVKITSILLEIQILHYMKYPKE